jgi:hypothetical protein
LRSLRGAGTGDTTSLACSIERIFVGSGLALLQAFSNKQVLSQSHGVDG